MTTPTTITPTKDNIMNMFATSHEQQSPRVGEERNRTVILTGAAKAATRNGRPCLDLLEAAPGTNGNPVQRVVIRFITDEVPYEHQNTEASAPGEGTRYENPRLRAFAALEGLGLIGSKGELLADKAKGLKVSVLEKAEEYQDQVRFRGAWVSLPRETLEGVVTDW